ncbi:MAG: Alpha-ketoglutarate-dependent taurine dioxygenase, partial [Pseudomonadota bacterium]
AMHTWEVTGWTEYLLRQDASGEQLQAARAKYPPVTHPVVRVHPITGKKILYVNPTFTTHIHGLPRTQSDALLAQLFALITAPEVQARWRWQPDTLAVWDNRSTQHYAVADFYPQHRKLHRITFTADQAF